MWREDIWSASMHAAQAADGPRLAEARGCLEHDLALEEASGVPPGRGLAALVSTEGHARQVKHRVEEIELKVRWCACSGSGSGFGFGGSGSGSGWGSP